MSIDLMGLFGLLIDLVKAQVTLNVSRHAVDLLGMPHVFLNGR